MRNARRLASLTTLLTLALGIVAYLASRTDLLVSDDGPKEPIVGISIALAAIAGIFALILWKISSATRRALRPDQRVSRWLVGAGTWDAFRTLDAERAAQVKGYVHVFKPRKNVPASGVDVIAAKGGIVIDGLFIQLEPRGLGAMTGMQWLSGKPECMEFAVRVPSGSPSSTMRVDPGLVRIPVEPAGREAAITAYHHFQALLQSGTLSDTRGHRTLVRFAVRLGLLLVVAGAIAMYLNQSGLMTNSLAVAVTAMVGLMGGAGSLFVALVVWWVMLRR